MKRLGVGILTFLMVVCTMFAAACTKVEFKVMFVVDGSVYASINTNGEEKIRMPDDPEKEGYIFDGWYWDEWSWQQPFTANSLFDAPLSSNMAVYAKWTTIEDLAGTQAEFDTFEKIGEYEYSLKVPNSTETISISPLVTINYNSSWSLTTDVYGNQTIASRTANLNVGDNTYYVVVRAANGATQLYTLNIRRRPIYNVVFDTFGGTFVETQQVEEDSFATLPQTTREGYEFSAWNYDFTTPITSNKTIVASWTPNTYTISLNPNGGSVSNATIEATYDQSCTLPTPLKTGYMLVGWNTEEDGSGVSYGDVNAILNLTSQNGATVELYAQWTERVVTATLADLSTTNPSHTVTFDLNGATGTAPAPQTVTDTLGLTYPTAPTRSEYVFAGWYATSSCTGSPYDFTADVTEDITLYAKWLSHSGYGTLRVGGNSGSITFPARSSSNYRYYAFVPLVSGSITIYSTSSSDTYGYLFNAVKTQIAYDDDSGDGGNFSITYSVTAGQLYYIVACAYSSSVACSGTIYISGASTPTAGGKADGFALVTEQLTYGQDFTLGVPTKIGYSFLGWYDAIGGTGTQYTDEFGASVKTWDKEEDVTLYAKWEAAVIAITFDKQNGIGGTDNISATYGEEMPEAIAPTRFGYTFMGYYTEISGGTKYYNADMTSAKDCDLIEDITLYAHWSAATYIITFDNQGGNGDYLAIVEYGSSLPIVSMPTKTGYTFLGYFDAMVGGTQYYDENAEGTISWLITEDITLYAQWEASEYIVSFDTNQGSGEQTSVTATYGEEMPEITVMPTREGYIFVGYYDAIIGGTKYYNSDLTSANAWEYASNKTLYARWQGISYYVSFNANGGRGTMSTQEFKYGTSESLYNNEFTHTEYTFVGWNTEADGSGTAYDDCESVLNLTSESGATVELYAQWTQKIVTVTL
ncbi:MAG: InlB B-repeat-containing protein, partial [Clostridia bacterium]|nr:InlB B-repeat-containing protein [Clostridia bacterium]